MRTLIEQNASALSPPSAAPTALSVVCARTISPNFCIVNTDFCYNIANLAVLRYYRSMSGNYENQLMSSASFEVHYKMDKDFKTVEMHSHDFFEVYCFLRGSASYIIEECKYTLLPGDILLIPQGKLHQLDIKDSTETYERYVLWINSKYIKKISSQKTDLRTCFECALKSKSFLIRNGAISQKIRRLLESITLSKEDAFGTDVENEERIKSFARHTCAVLFAKRRSNFCIRNVQRLRAPRNRLYRTKYRQKPFTRHHCRRTFRQQILPCARL